jgi:PKD repeat protein
MDLGTYIGNNTTAVRVNPGLRQEWNTLKLCSVDNVSTTWFNNQRFGKSASLNDLTTRVGWQLFFANVDNLHVAEIPDDEKAPYTSANLAPAVGTIAVTAQEQNQVTLTAPVSDDMNDTLTASWNWGDGNTTTGTVDTTFWPVSAAGSHTYTATGTYTVTLTVTDQAGASDSNTFEVNVTSLPNDPPVINPLSNASVNEGATYAAAGSFTDTGSTSWTATVDYGDGSGSQPLTLSGTNFSLSHIYQDNGAYTMTVSVTDNQGASDTETATVTVVNVASAVGTITASINPVQANTAITASAPFTDAGMLDSHTAVWNWGDGTTSLGTVTESNGSGSVSNSHTYTAAGVYEITLTVTDNDTAQGTSVYQYLTVFDTSAGWASGSKEFTSPTGAVSGNPNATGRADFGFQLKYQQGDIVPSGKNIELSFPQGNIEFTSTGYEWLVVNGTKATFKATGTLNGLAGYTVLVSAIDQGNGQPSGLVRFQIKEDSSGNVVYDTQPGAADTADPTTTVTKGKIQVH